MFKTIKLTQIQLFPFNIKNSLCFKQFALRVERIQFGTQNISGVKIFHDTNDV